VSSPYMEVLAAPQAIAADAGTATVVFLRPTGYAGRLKHMILDQKGRFLGECWGETYFSVKMPPGQYTFISWSEGTPALQATLDAGKVYYVEVGVTIGAWAARARLFGLGPQRESWAEVPGWMASSTMLVPNEAAGQAHLGSIQDRVNEVIQKGFANWAEYDAEARAKRSLSQADGVASTGPAPVSTGPAPVSTGPAPVSTGPAPVSTVAPPVNTGPAPVSTVAPPANSGAVETPASCRSHIDCKAPLVCPKGQCVAPACIADKDCGAGKMCTLEGACAPLR
jgi:hypothetical protein